MLGKRSKLVFYLIPWVLVGVILLSIPVLVSPVTEKALMTNPSGGTNPTTLGANTTTNYPIRISGSNNSVTVDLSNSFAFIVQSASPTNITIYKLNAGNVSALTITSTSPANVTV